MDRSKYVSPFAGRYASHGMQHLFSQDFRFKTWRRLWLALARAQQALGLNISNEQIQELEANVDNINYEQAEALESELRHDVMAHVHAYGLQCPKAKGIIHLGATSCYVGDNAELIIMREGLKAVRAKALAVIKRLATLAHEFKDMPTLGFTHFQPAQPVTVGKRVCLWIHDLVMDVEELDFVLSSLKFLGSRGTTGTSASFMALFDNDESKVKQLEQSLAAAFGFDGVYPVSGQTYSRKVDSRVMNLLAQFAASCAKFSNDLRLLAHLREMEEPFESKQIGSSAMAYKRNPMRAERMSSLCRHIIANMQNTAMTAQAQWLERTLDDSANKRIAIPEAFLALDGVLDIYLNIAGGLVIYPKVIEKRLADELPFMATEDILMAAVKKGGDRQVLHEAIRQHSMEAAALVREGKSHSLLDNLAKDPLFDIDLAELSKLLEPSKYVGRAPSQVSEFLSGISHLLAQADDVKTELRI